MTYGFIYKIQFPNGKHYVGLTTNSLSKRRNEHKHAAKSGNTKCLYNALRKYDMVDTFELIELDNADTLEELCEKEKEYIIKYNSYYMNGNGYNMTFGGEGVNGYVYTEEDKQKMSEIMKKRYKNPEAIQKNSEALKKYHQENPDAGKEHGERMKDFWENPEARNRQSEITKKHHEEHPETRVRQSEKRKKTFQENPEILERMSEKRKKLYKDNPELGKEHGEKIKKYHEEHPETRNRMSEIKKKYYQDNPEAIEKNREAMKNRSPEWIKKRNDTQGKNKPFDVFTKDGTFIQSFTYPFEAKEYLQNEYHHIKSSPAIGKVLNGKKRSSLGFIFKYKEI